MQHITTAILWIALITTAIYLENHALFDIQSLLKLTLP
jgi:hypothetical protein